VSRRDDERLADLVAAAEAIRSQLERGGLDSSASHGRPGSRGGSRWIGEGFRVMFRVVTVTPRGVHDRYAHRFHERAARGGGRS
jgi:hypothetical protein